MRCRTLLTPSFAVIFLSANAHAQHVGNVGAVNQSAFGTPPGQSARELSLGVGVFDHERIETKREGNAQIVFTDKSTMTIGRNSAVTIDRFVFDRNAGAGSQAVSVAKGVMRFVGGGVSHGGGTNVRTPTALVGVRGGTGLFVLGGACGTLAINQYGVLTVGNARGSVQLSRSGVGVCVPSNDGPISEPFRVPPETIARILAQLGSGKGQKGGARHAPENMEAHVRLGDSRPPNDVGAPNNVLSLGSLGLVWAGNALVQSRSGTENQPLPPAPPAHRSNPDTCDCRFGGPF